MEALHQPVWGPPQPSLHSCSCSLHSLGTRRWLRVPKCTTTSTKSSRCSPWRSKQPGSRQRVLSLTGMVLIIPLGFTSSLHLLPPRHKEEPKLPDSASSDEENEDGDFTVYECPGLAPVCGCRRDRGPCACGGCPISAWDVHFSVRSLFHKFFIKLRGGPTSIPLLPPCPWPAPTEAPRWAGMHVLALGFPWEQITRAALGPPDPPSLWQQGHGHRSGARGTRPCALPAPGAGAQTEDVLG